VTDLESVSGLKGVSRETLADLETYQGLLEKWQASINLVAPSTLADAWERHFVDSAQLISYAPETIRLWLDVGSGAGFPGLVIALLMRDTHPGAAVVMVESDSRKCAFLQTVIAETKAPARVINMRVEKAANHVGDAPQVISARAVAPLPRLLEMVAPFWTQDCVGLFMKGRDVASELTEAAKCWTIKASQAPSITAGEGVILKLEELARVRAERPR